MAKNPEITQSAEGEVKDSNSNKLQFLGEGYYFWDNNLKRAHRWGKTHYDGKYLIMQIPLELKGNRFIDLVGSREDISIFCESFKEMRKNIPGLTVGSFFFVMQKMEKYEHGSWPFTIIRALNLKKNAEAVPFNHLQDSKMSLNPEIIICFYDRNELNLHCVSYINQQDKKWTPKIS